MRGWNPHHFREFWNNTDKTLYQIALTHITGVGVALARNLMQIVGDEEQIFKEHAGQITNDFKDEILTAKLLLNTLLFVIILIIICRYCSFIILLLF